MMHTLLSELFAYNRWANGKILDKATDISTEELYAQVAPNHGSLHGTLFHMLRAEWLWRQLSQHGRFLEPRPQEEALADLADLRLAWEMEARELERYIAGLDSETLAVSRDLRDPRGGRRTYTHWEMLTHLALHSMQHRAEAAAVLTQFGHSPGDLDFIFFTKREGK